MTQQAAPAVIGILNAAKGLTSHTVDAIVVGQPLVEEGVICCVQLEDRAILTDQVGEEKLGFRPHGVSQLLVVVGEPVGIRVNLVEILKAQPLSGESGSERLGAGVGEHAPDLLLKHTLIGQTSVVGQTTQLIVGRECPQEE